MNKRLQTVSSFISPFWMRMVANRTFQSEVNQQGEIIVEGESLAFQDKAQALAAGTKVMVTVGQWITCLALDEYLSDVESRKSLLEVEAMDRQERSRALSRQAAAFNAGLNIPVAWSVGIKVFSQASGRTPMETGTIAPPCTMCCCSKACRLVDLCARRGTSYAPLPHAIMGNNGLALQ